MAYLVDPGLPLALSLDNFIVGSSNQKVHKFCVEALDNTKRYNPIVIVSPNGCGKTHLLVALFRKSLLDFSYLRSLYLDGASLQRLLAEARGGELPQLDLLFLDDLQSLPPDLEGPFLAFFDRSFHSSAQIFIALDREINKLHLGPGVMSRLKQGFCARLDLPDALLRRAFIEKEFYKRHGEPLEAKKLEFLTEATQTKSMREILGILQNEAIDAKETLGQPPDDCAQRVPGTTLGAHRAPSTLGSHRDPSPRGRPEATQKTKIFGFVFMPLLETEELPKDYVMSSLGEAIKNNHLKLNPEYAGPFLYRNFEDIVTMTNLWPLFGRKPDFVFVLLKPTETVSEEQRFSEVLTASLRNASVLSLLVSFRERNTPHVYLSAALELLHHCSQLESFTL